MSIRIALCLLVLFAAVAFSQFSRPVLAADATLVGTVTARYGNQIVLKTTAATQYRVEASYASPVRRNGSPLSMEDVLIGDKLEVRGQIWADNSVSASAIRDVSVYTHTGTFTGKISAIDQVNRVFVLQSSQSAPQTIHTTAASVFTKNGSSVEFKDMATGMSATVRGTWERNKQDVVATSVRVTVRLLNIDITGDVTLKDGLALTVAANGVLYSVDATGATVKSKNNKPLALTELGLGRVRVRGKHITESTMVKAERIKYLDLVK